MAPQLFKQALCLGIFTAGLNVSAQELISSEDLLRLDRCSIDLSEIATFQAGAESLTRNYNLDLLKLRIESQTPEKSLREKFESRGLTLEPEDLFLNDRTGELTLRATRKEFSVIEEIVAPLRTTKSNPNEIFSISPAEWAAMPQVLIESRYIEYSGELPFTLESKQDTAASKIFNGILTTAQFEKAIHALENTQGIDVLTAPTLRTISGRQARIEVETTKTIMFQTPPRQPRRVTPDSDPTPIEITKPGI